MILKNLQRFISACVVIRNNRINLRAKVIKRIAQNQGFVSDPGNANKKVFFLQQSLIADEDAFGLPQTSASGFS
ncbi:hypothetical protein SAMN05720382_10862 [Polaromonas sp. JS666]|nr:hypothetical protein SAMN05720382_10862 [Polaromonas sp. JS666]